MTTPTHASTSLTACASLLAPFTPSDFQTYGGVESKTPHIFSIDLPGYDGVVVLLDGSKIEVHFIDGEECEVDVWSATLRTTTLARMVADNICASISTIIRDSLETYEQKGIVRTLKHLGFTKII